MAKQTLYILYNADSSVLGKLHYGYRKILHSKKTEPECSACDITHGGLSFTESDAWLTAKTEIEASFDTSVVQWHRDELSPQVWRSRHYMQRLICLRSEGISTSVKSRFLPFCWEKTVGYRR